MLIGGERVVTKVQSDSGRALYRVSNECISELEDPAAQEIINTCMINPRYCNCDKFIQDVILRNDMVMVKCGLIRAVLLRHGNNQVVLVSTCSGCQTERVPQAVGRQSS